MAITVKHGIWTLATLLFKEGEVIFICLVTLYDSTKIVSNPNGFSYP